MTGRRCAFCGGNNRSKGEPVMPFTAALRSLGYTNDAYAHASCLRSARRKYREEEAGALKKQLEPEAGAHREETTE